MEIPPTGPGSPNRSLTQDQLDAGHDLFEISNLFSRIGQILSNPNLTQAQKLREIGQQLLLIKNLEANLQKISQSSFTPLQITLLDEFEPNVQTLLSFPPETFLANPSYWAQEAGALQGSARELSQVFLLS